MVQKNLKRVRRQVREAVGGQFFERGDERLAAARGLGGEAVRLELVPARKHVGRDRQGQPDRRE